MRYRDNLPLVGTNLLRMIYMVGSAIVLQLYLKELGASPFEISLLEVIFWGGMLIFAPLWGALSDASGRRKILLVISTLGAALLIPFFMFLDSIGAVLGLRFLFAVIAVAFPPAALAAMSAHSSTEHRGRDLAPYNTSRAVGFLIGWGGAGGVLALLGFPLTFTLFGAIGIIGFLVALFIRDIDEPEDVTLQEVWQNAKQRWIPSRGDASFTKNGLHYLFAALLLRKAALIGIMSLVAVYVTDVVGVAEALLGFFLALNPAAQLLFIDLFGTLADKHGRKRVFLFGFLATIPVPFLLMLGANHLLLGLAFLLIGISFAAVVQGTTTFIGDTAPTHRQGEFMGFRKSAQGFAGVIGPLLAGGIATIYDFNAMLVAMSFLTVLATLVAWWGTDESMDHVDPSFSLREDVAETFYTVVDEFRPR